MPPSALLRTGKAKARATYLRRLDICATVGHKAGLLRPDRERKAALNHGISVSTVRTIHKDHCVIKGSLDVPDWFMASWDTMIGEDAPW